MRDIGRRKQWVFIRSASTVSLSCARPKRAGPCKTGFGQNSGKKNDDEVPEQPEEQQVGRLGDIAGRLERAFPQFDDRLRSTVDFATGGATSGQARSWSEITVTAIGQAMASDGSS